MRIVVVMTHCQRPAYSQQSLDALAVAIDRAGVDIHKVGLFVEPVDDEVIGLCRAFGPGEVHLNGTKRGVNANTVRAFDWGFHTEDSAFVILVENDIVLAPDALAYFAWAAEAFQDDATVGSVTGYNRLPEMAPASEWHAVRARPWLHPWSIGFWRRSWAQLRGAATVPEETWDVNVNRERQRLGLTEVYPELSRAQNIGLYSSVHRNPPPPSWYAEHHFLKFWAGQVDVPPGTFHYAPSLRGEA